MTRELYTAERGERASVPDVLAQFSHAVDRLQADHDDHKRAIEAQWQRITRFLDHSANLRTLREWNGQ